MVNILGSQDIMVITAGNCCDMVTNDLLNADELITTSVVF